ncbi:tRNA 2-thiocytidine biosynthesis protein TtcA [Saezia sanguinis]|uniref:tRNA-cytidine(32) 2-sulfurtransferase n=1 Tax=Saezia sanguinis TaxID=1965230 RepID=A0A433SC87_9BURK|nr:tRNA 2-thiocytidine biosynthesis protein TtcA [Saezia sanguinis]
MSSTENDSSAETAHRLVMTQKARKTEFENNKLGKRLCRKVTQAISDYNMIEPGDKVMVCLSGGKDSFSLLDILLRLQRRAPFDFEIVAVNLDQKQPGFPAHVLPQYLTQLGVPFHIEDQDTYSIVKRVVPEGKTMCSLCSRLRRGVLYRVAGELGATKIALGHHRDDMLQTLLLNMFFAAKLKGMPPKLVSDDGKHIVIRPLAYVDEKSLERWAQVQQFPIIPCSLCGSQENLQRQQMKQMLQEWDKKFPGRIYNMFNALSHVVPSHLMDRTLYPFENLKATGVADPEGDTAFDQESFPGPGENDNAADTGAELPAEQHIAVHQIQRAKASS